MPAKIQLTEEQIKEMYRLFSKEKNTIAQIAKKFNVSNQTVSRRLEETFNIKNFSNNKYIYNEYYFNEIDDHDKAYWLGFIFGDGYIHEGRNLLAIKLGGIDESHLYKFKKCIQAENPVKIEYHNITGNKLVKIELSGKQIVSDLQKLGVFKKENRKQIPNIDKKFLPDFIRGLFDSDGGIYKNRLDLCGSYEVCKFVQETLIEKCGASHTKIFFHTNTYRVHFAVNRLNIIRYLYPANIDKNIYLDRKYKRARIESLHLLNKKK